LDPLAHDIIPAESETAIRSTKVEFKLKKKTIGVKWNTLEGQDDVTTVMMSGN
jgi:suppressor of G2 allele of SKP1